MTNPDEGSRACETPLVELLRGVPADARMTYEHSPTHHQMIPVGSLCHRAAHAIVALPMTDKGSQELIEKADRMVMFLEILTAIGGTADASDCRFNWINAFCEEHEKRDPDTFNQAIVAGYVDWSHDSDSDNSTIRLTDKGRAAAIPPRAALSATPLVKLREALDDLLDYTLVHDSSLSDNSPLVVRCRAAVTLKGDDCGSDISKRL